MQAVADYSAVKLILYLCFLTFITSLPLTCAGAATQPGLYAAAREDLAEGRHSQAFDKFSLLFSNDPADPDINFYLGRAAFESGDYETAVMAFERVLIMRPEALRVKLELARAYYRLGSYATARQYFMEVLETEPPAAVRRNITAMLTAIDRAENPHQISGAVSIGVTSDDNANVAPSSDNILVRTALGDIPITTTRSRSDQIRTNAVSINYAYHVPQRPLAFKTAITNYVAEYLDETYLDVHLLAIQGGIALNLGRITWDIYGLGNGLRVDHHRYVKTGGFGTTLSLPLTSSRASASYLNSTTQNFYTVRDKNAHNARLTLAQLISYRPHSLKISGSCEKENARNDINSYRRQEACINYACDLPWNLGLSGSFCRQHSGYRENNPLFMRKRSDTVDRAACGLRWDIFSRKSLKLGTDLGYTLTRARSNIDLYTYNKNAVTANLTFSF